MPKEKPLYLRLYTEPPLIALVRLIGYAGLPVAEAKERLKPLVEEYGKGPMQRAAADIIRIDTAHMPPFARLTDAVRKLAWQLLGPPPDAPEAPDPEFALRVPRCLAAGFPVEHRSKDRGRKRPRLRP